jgi:hypothetical protein
MNPFMPAFLAALVLPAFALLVSRRSGGRSPQHGNGGEGVEPQVQQVQYLDKIWVYNIHFPGLYRLQCEMPFRLWSLGPYSAKLSL